MKLSSMCVGPHCQLHSSGWCPACGRQLCAPVWLLEPDFAWLMGPLQEPTRGGLTFPHGPAMVAASFLFFLAVVSHSRHVQHWSGRLWHRFNIGSLILFFPFFSQAFNLLKKKINSRG